MPFALHLAVNWSWVQEGSRAIVCRRGLRITGGPKDWSLDVLTKAAALVEDYTAGGIELCE